MEIIENEDLQEINWETREAVLSGGKRVPYSALYHYLELTEPAELKGINSLDINKETLRHNKYDNITVFGNA